MRSFSFSSVIIVLLFLSTSGFSTPATPFTTPIYVSNGSFMDTLILGVNPCASMGVDLCTCEAGDSLNAGPEDPYAGFIGFASGFGYRKCDIRYLTSDYQTDTFKIGYSSGFEGNENFTFSWSPSIGDLGGGYWHLVNSLSDATIDIDMTTRSSYTVNSFEYSFLYIIKSDGKEFRTFSLSDLALDKDLKGKYGKPNSPKPDRSSFCVTFPFTDTFAVNGLHVEWTYPVDSSSVSTTPTMTRVSDSKFLKWEFSGDPLFAGDELMVCGFALKPNAQSIKKWWWTNNGVRVSPVKKRTDGNLVFVTRDRCYPLPNTVNAGEEMIRQAFPEKTDYLILGIPSSNRNGPPSVLLKKYSDILKTLVVNPGKINKELLQDSYEDCLSKFDRVKGSGDRSGRAIKGAQKVLSPDKHRNKLLGEALTFAVNVKLSQTQKTPAGLGSLLINDPTSYFYGLTLDSLLSKAGEYLTYCNISGNPTIAASDIVDELERVNEAFMGELDTISWSGTKVVFTGAKPIAEVPFLKRPFNFTATIIPDLQNPQSEKPGEFILAQNYPNPFNPTTTIRYEVGSPGIVTLSIYNLLGQEVSTLLDNLAIEGGEQEVVFDASGLASGIYYYQLHVFDQTTGLQIFHDVKKMILVR